MDKKVSPPVKKIKTEPDTSPYAEYDDCYALGACSSDLNGDALLNFTLDGYKSPPVTKHTSSPAQEATRARISTCEGQLKKLYKQRALGKLDSKGAMQIRLLEDDLRKAHAKLRRLLNEAERQRRRRERLRCGLSASPIASSASSKMMMIVRGSGRHGYDNLPTIASYGSHQAEVVTSGSHDDGIMAALKHCSRFDDFIRELNTLGFSLNRVGEDNHVVYDVPEDGESGTDGEVRVQVELIEGDAALEQSMTVEGENDIQEIKAEPLSPPPSSPTLSDNQSHEDKAKERRTSGETRPPDNDAEPRTAAKNPAHVAKAVASECARKYAHCLRDWQEQYQEWYERQVESQQQWEETFMREQMELAKSMLENVTSTFLQGMQQVLQNVVGSVGRRSMTPFVPTFPHRTGLDLNGLNLNHQSDMPIFINSESNGPTVLSSRSLSDDHQNSR